MSAPERTTMLDVVDRPLPYVDRLEARSPETIRRVVIHATELPDLATAREYGERIQHRGSRTGNSGHFYVDRDGAVECWVPPERIAHHVAGHNADSIGIELVNRGRWPDWYHSQRQGWSEDYPEAQLDALIELLAGLQRRLPSLAIIAGHDELDRRRVPASDDPDARVPRKIDPGPPFPWPRVLAAVSLRRVPAEEGS
jgi:N-acetylmuramoyl-L-alanine amidase